MSMSFKKIADIVGWIGTALIVAAALVVVAAWAGFIGRQPTGLVRGLVFAGLACIVVYLAGHGREILQSFSRRQTRLGTFAGLSVLAMLGILVAVNYVSARQHTRWDLTEARQFTLSDQTQNILRTLDAPTTFLVFARTEEFGRFRDRLTQYAGGSPHVTVEYIDIDRQPARARQYQIQQYGTIVIEHKDRVERVTSSEEQAITNALIKVVEGRQPTVYFTEGHGEKSPTSADQRAGYNAIAGELRNENFQVEQLVLAQHPDVPADADVVVVAGPEIDFLPGEIDALRRYLHRGGKALFMIDPPEDERPHLPNLTAFIREWGIEAGHDIVVDASGVGQLIGTDASVPVAASYPSHPITDRFNLLTAYPLARSVTPVEGGVDGRVARSFIETSPRSWAEQDIRGLMTTGEVGLDEAAGDVPGPVSIGAAVSIPAPEPPEPPEPAAVDGPGEDTATDGTRTPEARVAVIGDSDFASNAALGISGNRDLFLNVVNWLADQEALIAIRAREPQDRRLMLTAQQQQVIFLFAIVLVPGAVLATGVYAWWRRR
jgi:ABC-type uncharacterized transport system involved in gliding motility auxiliary subunit